VARLRRFWRIIIAARRTASLHKSRRVLAALCERWAQRQFKLSFNGLLYTKRRWLLAVALVALQYILRREQNMSAQPEPAPGSSISMTALAQLMLAQLQMQRAKIRRNGPLWSGNEIWDPGD
jgi:hypothetical protein